jgi:hypothetical protein
MWAHYGHTLCEGNLAWRIVDICSCVTSTHTTTGLSWETHCR